MPNSVVPSGLCTVATLFPAFKRRAIIEKSLRDSLSRSKPDLRPAGSPQIFADFPEQFCNSTVKAVFNPE